MTDGPGVRRSGQSALLGAVIVLGVIWIGVVGFHLYRRDWTEALFWGAIAAATSAGAWASLIGSRRRH